MIRYFWIFFLLSTVAYAKEVRVCEHPDGSLAIIHWNTQSRVTPDFLQGLPCIDTDSSALPDRSRRDAWRLKNGKIKADPSIETRREKNQRKRAQGINKLKQLGLTDEELDALGM